MKRGASEQVGMARWSRTTAAIISVASLSGLLLGGACNKEGADAKKDPAAPASATTGSASAGSLASAKTPPKPAPPPTWKAQKIDGGEHQLASIYKLSNGVAVSDADKKVGHLTDKGIEWLEKTIPPAVPGLGATVLQHVYGSWPDNIYAQYTSSQGRAPQPTLWPLTGKGSTFRIAPGGGWGDFTGFVEYGESTIVSAKSLPNGIQYRTIRGPGFPLITTKATAENCDRKTLRHSLTMENPPAMDPEGFEATKAGTFMAIGVYCKEEAPYAEVWKGKGQGKLINLSQWTQKVISPKLIAGKGDEMFVQPNRQNANIILRYKDGAFSKVPAPRWLLVDIFGSDGDLIIFDGKTLRKLTGDQWSVVAYLEGDASRLRNAFMYQGTLYGENNGVVKYVLSENKVVHKDECGKPLVYMYRASYKNDDKFTYPSTRKAVSSFAGAKDVELMEFKHSYTKHVAIAVNSDEQGAALIEHLKTAMPKEQPYMVCYEPKNKRVIPLQQ